MTIELASPIADLGWDQCDGYLLTTKEYEAVLNLYHEFNAAYSYLPNYIKGAFLDRLYGRAKNW